MDRSNAQRIWIPPLPQGWEARFDHNQRRYFFINHQTKATQWDDPRYSQPRPSSTSASTTLGSNTTRQSQGAQARQAEQIPMRDLSPRHSGHGNRGSQRQEESSMTRELNTSIINNLHKEFPSVSKDLITDMFYLCHENGRETREQLKDLGFLKESKPQQQPQSHQHRPTATPPQPPQEQLAPKPEISESQKRQLVNQLKAQFTQLEANVINMALLTCDYRLEDTKRLLQAWGQRSSPTRNTSASTTSSGASASVAAPANLEPAALPSASDNSPRALSAGSSSTRPSPTRSGTSHAERGRNTAAGPSRSDRIGSAAQHLKASDVTKKRSTKAPRKKETVVTSQPTAGGQATSPSHRTSAKGSDASLRKGPDSSLLITAYEPAQGPDKSLRQGPDRGRAFGPLGAKGSDPSLRCGPQSSLLQSRGVATFRPVETHI